MKRFLGLALVGLLASVASAQTVRFQTNAGDFDMVLNPTGNPDLQGHVDNLLQYVTSGRYDNSVINRAAEDFVLQLGSFKTASADVPATIDGFLPIQEFAPVQGMPQINGLSNVRGTVGMALRSDVMGGYDQNSGTSSFYINLADNSFLDSDFTVFAQIPNMTTIDAIMALPQVELPLDPNFGASAGNLAFTDVPLVENDKLVIIARAFVVPEPGGGTLVSVAAAVLVGLAAVRCDVDDESRYSRMRTSHFFSLAAQCRISTRRIAAQ
jgi:cyclophilin family peptidyl-prolyl cis-trans isomerase